MRIACLFSGGKDSCLALHRAHAQGLRVDALLTFAPESDASWMFHHPNVWATALQAKALGIRHVLKRTAGERDSELTDLKNAIAELRADALLTGAVASSYQKGRIDRICAELGIKSIAPLWHNEPESLLREALASGFETIITSVSAEGFDASWLGRRIDGACIADLKRLHEACGVSMVGEGGEFETFVLDAPLFERKIKVLDAKAYWQGQAGRYTIEKAELADKRRH